MTPPLFLIAAMAAGPPLVIDTDCGSDDFMAMAFLLSRPEVKIEAITVANGLAHVDAGARNVLRLLALAGRRDIPVYAGSSKPMLGNAEFPAEWRKRSDELPGVRLPAATRAPEKTPAADFLRRRIGQGPLRMLALGPLTNLAQSSARLENLEITIMGGAVRVPGNLGDGGVYKTDNSSAEWNIYVDPAAARMVFASGARIRLVPLDATNRVPIDAAFFEAFKRGAKTPLARFVGEILGTDREYIEQHFFYAWDPLAASSLVNPAVCRFRPLRIEVRMEGKETGRTAEAPGRPNAEVALDADAVLFRQVFLGAFAVAQAGRP